MDETHELTAEAVEQTTESRSRIDDLRVGLEAAVRDIEERVVAAGPTGFEQGVRDSLEVLVAVFNCERGFFIVGHSGRAGDWSPGTEAPTSIDISVAASRARATETESEWRDVTNPDYAFDRSAVASAFSSEGVVARDATLTNAADEDGERHRPILCCSCRFTSEVRAVVYLEGRLAQETNVDGHAEVFGWLVDRLGSVWARSFLEGEVVRLERAPNPYAGAIAGDEGTDGEALAEMPDEAPSSYHGIIGSDEKLQKVFAIIEKIKDSDLNVCIFGESGTGKELVARAIHEASSRSQAEFVSENCGAISETLLESELFGHVKGSFTGADEDRKGLFELADKGTLFLDEIGDMSEQMQRKLLRALQEGVIRPIGSKDTIRVDVRVLCASNRDLKHLVQRNEFRADLYYRLNVITIQVPPLRERRGDIPVLIQAFTREVEATDGVRKRLSESALRALVQYGWPGNVRELRNVVRRALLTATRRVVARKDVMPFLAGGAQGTACLGENLERDDDQLLLRIPMRHSFNEIIDECESLVLRNALKENGWNKSRVTKALGIPRQSLYNKIAKYRLKKPSAGEDE